MSHSVLVFSSGEEFAGKGFPAAVSPATGAVRSFLLDMIAKEEFHEDGSLVVHLNAGFCVMEVKEGFALYACSGEYHVSEPLIIFPKSSVLRLMGDHEFECHHKDLPVN